MEHVGVVLGIETSRLARSNKDWHQLLDLCAIFGTVLADKDGIYDANDSNDRLLLGLKGTISAFEFVTYAEPTGSRTQEQGAPGRAIHVAPIGYVRQASDELAFDPDEQVKSVVRLIFEKFEELRSASAVLRYFVRHGILIGVREVNGLVPSPIKWRPLSTSTLLELLYNPTHAGAYCQGRRSYKPRATVSPSSARKRYLPMDEWDVLLKGSLPAHITWDQFLANQATLKSNQTRMSSLGSVRNGGGLLPGLLVCGICGALMVVQYKKSSLIRIAACSKRSTALQSNARPLKGIQSRTSSGRRS
jgi:hypothetical protein